MAKTDTPKTLSNETIEQLHSILDKVFDEGQHWIKSVGTKDWRRLHYLSTRARRQSKSAPSTSQIVEAVKPVLDYIAKAATSFSGAADCYVIVKPENGCLKEEGIALLRPVLKFNRDGEPQLNFHVWFHCKPNANPDDHLMAGWRLESPEGSNTTHHFFHAQPLRRYGSDNKTHGLPDRFPERFPTIPLPATNTIELCLAAVLVACGKDALHSLARSSDNGKVREAAQAFYDKVVKVA